LAYRRRRPDLRGLAGLSRADFDSWRAGRTTQADIGDRLGISPSAVNRRFRRWAAAMVAAPEATSAPAASPAPAAPTPTASPATATTSAASPAHLPEFTSEDAVAVAKSAAIAVLVRTHELLIMPGVAIGPSGLKAAAAAVRESTDLLSRLGVVDFVEAAGERPVALTIRRLTDAEEVEIQRQAELSGAGLEPDDYLEDANVTSAGTDDDAGVTETAA
jgi:hypothetical protein